MRIIDYELTCDISCLFGKRIFIYGTGVYGQKVATVLLQMQIEISGFCETNPKKNEFLGGKNLSVKTLIENYDECDVLVIVASEKYYKEMIKELQDIENMALCTYYALFISLYLNYENDGVPEALKSDVRFFKNTSLHMAVVDLLKFEMADYNDILAMKSLVWLYQPGKVGSTTIDRSNLSKDCHMHTLALAFNGGGGVPFACKNIIADMKKNSIKIITGIREPISRDISLFFQSSDIDIWPLIKWGGSSSLYLFGDYSKNGRIDLETLKKRTCILEKSLNYTFEHIGKEITRSRADEFTWFDYEIKALLGIDIYDYPFDREKGYTIIEQDNICILLYKCEKLNQLGRVIGDFLENPGFSLTTENQGEEKIYSYVYKGFKENVQLSKEYFDYYYADNSRLRHFYTDSEIKQFKNKWKKKLK